MPQRCVFCPLNQWGIVQQFKFGTDIVRDALENIFMRDQVTQLWRQQIAIIAVAVTVNFWTFVFDL